MPSALFVSGGAQHLHGGEYGFDGFDGFAFELTSQGAARGGGQQVADYGHLLSMDLGQAPGRTIGGGEVPFPSPSPWT